MPPAATTVPDSPALRLAAILAAAGLAAGCASYAPAPIDAHDVAAARRDRTLDPEAVRTELAQLAPGYAWNGSDWNGLTLLAAAIVVSPALAEARAGIAAAEAEAAAARVSPGPTLTLSAEYAFNPTESSHWLYGLASEWLRDRGGRREGRIATAEVAVRAASFDYAAAVWAVRSAIRRALDARATWEAEVAIADELVAMRQRQFEAVNRRVAAGEVPRFELDRVRADAAAAATRSAQARAKVVRAGLDLAAAVGVIPDAIDLERVVAVDLGDLADVAPLDGAQRASALDARTEILQATAAYDRAEASLRIAVASQFPELRLGPGYTWERGLSKVPFTLGLALPTSDRAHAAIAAGEARRTTAGRQLEAAVAAVEAGIDRADADYRAALSLLDLVRSQTLPTAAALAAQAERELEAGAINRADWAGAQAGLLGARLDEIEAIRGTLEAQTALEDALRRPFHGPESQLAENQEDGGR